MEKLVDRVIKWLDSDKFDKISYWIIGLSFSYFFIRTLVSIIWDI